MIINFQINYRAEWGQELCVIETRESILGWTEEHPLVLSCQGQDFWTTGVPVSDFAGEVYYKYAIRLADGGYIYEAGNERKLPLISESKKVTVRDFWQVNDYEKAFYSTVFQHALFRRVQRVEASVPEKEAEGELIQFSIDAPQVLPTQGVAVIGNTPELGNWNDAEKLILTDAEFPVWKGSIKTDADIIEYKYVIYELHSGKVIDTEFGENRKIYNPKGIILQNDRCFRRTQPKWKGAGVAIPVFSLRSENDFGIGEFLDLKLFADWAAATGQKMIQTLPINDTTLTHTNLDSYPYNAVSVFALHPIYINIEKMGKLSPALKKAYKKEQKELNALDFADYQNVYDKKMRFSRPKKMRCSAARNSRHSLRRTGNGWSLMLSSSTSATRSRWTCMHSCSFMPTNS